MAQPPPPPQAWYPAASPSRSIDPKILGIVIAVVVIGLFGMFAVLLTGLTGGLFPIVSFGFICLPFLFVILFVVIALAAGTGRRTIPPPPPIQQPMVPAGQQGPVALNCPNCGGPPMNVDRFGIATCSYCGTRFLVR